VRERNRYGTLNDSGDKQVWHVRTGQEPWTSQGGQGVRGRRQGETARIIQHSASTGGKEYYAVCENTDAVGDVGRITKVDLSRMYMYIRVPLTFTTSNFRKSIVRTQEQDKFSLGDTVIKLTYDILNGMIFRYRLLRGLQLPIP
jgi:hypothetical protein